MKPPEETYKDSNGLATNNLNLNLFWELQSKDTATRLKASHQLTTTLQLQQNQMAEDEISSELEYTFSRLIQGLGSERKQVKVGFSTSLTNLLMNIPSSLMSSKRFLYVMNDQLPLSGKQSSKKVLKEIYIGRLFCLLCLIKSSKLTRDADYESLNATVDSLLKLSRKKPSLKKLSYYAIHELILKVDNDCFDNGIWSALFPLFKTGWSDCSIEVLLLLMTCCKHHPETCGKYFLRKFKWISSNDSSLVNKTTFPYLSELIGKSVVCRPLIDVLMVNVFTYIAEQKLDFVVEFWTSSLHKELLSTSLEKKFLAFHLALCSLPFISANKVASVWTKELIGFLHHALANKQSSIHQLCKKDLTNELAKQMKDGKVSADVQYTLLIQLYSSFPDISGSNFVHRQLIDSLVHHLRREALLKYITWLKDAFRRGYLFDEEASTDGIRKWCCTQLAQLVKQTTLPRYEEWISDVVKFLFLHSYFAAKSPDEKSTVKEDSEGFIDVSAEVREQVVRSFTSTLFVLNHSEQFLVDKQDNGSSQRSLHHGQMSSGEFWTTHIVRHAQSVAVSQPLTLLFAEESAQSAWDSATKHLKKLLKYKGSEVDARVLELLLTNLTLQLFSTDEFVRKSSVGIITDLQVIISDIGKKKGSTPDEANWLEVVVEIILSLLLSESRVMRSAVEQAFRILCPRITKQALRMILDVLESQDEKKLMEVQDDEEIMNGEGSSEEDSDMEEEEGGEHPDHGVDEIFRSEVRQALGSAALPLEDSDDADDGDLDDEAMMRLDPMLSDIFKRKKKSDSQTTKKQMFEFQSRCLMLIEIFLSRHYDNHYLIIDLPLPLLKIIEQSSTDSRKANIAERTTVILRAKLCRMKNLPRDLDSATLTSCHDNITTLLSMAMKGNRGLFINQLISQCCLFYLKILTKHEFDSQSISRLYSDILADFMTRRQSKVQHFILSDFARNFPAICQDLAEDLIKYCATAVQPYRRLQACMLLSTLCNSKISSQHMEALSSTLLKRLKKILRSITSQPSDVNSKYLVQLLRLFHFAVKTLQSCEKVGDWRKVVKILEGLLGAEVVSRSPTVTNHVWKVLQLLNVNRPPQVKTKEKVKVKPADEEADEKTRESSRQLKQRIMREKKKGAGKRLKLSHENLRNNEDGTT